MDRAGWRFEENDVEAGADKQDADAGRRLRTWDPLYQS